MNLLKLGVLFSAIAVFTLGCGKETKNVEKKEITESPKMPYADGEKQNPNPAPVIPAAPFMPYADGEKPAAKKINEVPLRMPKADEIPPFMPSAELH